MQTVGIFICFQKSVDHSPNRSWGLASGTQCETVIKGDITGFFYLWFVYESVLSVRLLKMSKRMGRGSDLPPASRSAPLRDVMSEASRFTDLIYGEVTSCISWKKEILFHKLGQRTLRTSSCLSFLTGSSLWSSIVGAVCKSHHPTSFSRPSFLLPSFFWRSDRPNQPNWTRASLTLQFKAFDRCFISRTGHP